MNGTYSVRAAGADSSALSTGRGTCGALPDARRHLLAPSTGRLGARGVRRALQAVSALALSLVARVGSRRRARTVLRRAGEVRVISRIRVGAEHL